MIRRFSFLMMFFVLTLGVSSCGSDDEDDRSSGNSPLPSPSVVYLWLPSKSFSGNLGGIAGANATCQTAAAAADGPTFETEVSTHRALLSSSTQDARNLFANNPPVKRPNGTDIIDNYADYFNPGETLEAVIENSTIVVWTGTSSDGTPSDENCNDWTSDDVAVRGADGSVRAANGSRLNYGGVECDSDSSSLGIVCMSY